MLESLEAYAAFMQRYIAAVGISDPFIQALVITSLVAVPVLLTVKFLWPESREYADRPVEHAGDLVASTIAKQGARFLFTLTGGHISPILVSCKKNGIRCIDVRHEVNAVFAADAVARLTGIPGVAAVTAGPGLTNTITAIKNAQMAQSPVVLLGGATATVLKGRGSLQDIDQQALFRPHVKWMASVKHVRNTVSTIETAFKIAKSGVPGPVFVELPVDVLYPESVVRDWSIKTIKGNSLVAKLTRFYLSRHYDIMFWRTNKTPLPKRVVIEETPPPSSSIRSAARAIAGARHPLFIVGSQAVSEPSQSGDVAEALEAIGAPVYLSSAARGVLGRSAPLQGRHRRREAIREADVVVLVGVPCDFRLNYGMSFTRCKLISLNNCAEDLTKNRKPDIGILCNPATALSAIAEEIGQTSRNWKEWVATIKKRDAERDAEIAKNAEKETAFVNPIKACVKVEEHMGDKAIIVADGGDFVATMSYVCKPRAPLAWMDPGPFGTLGVGAGFALGAKLCRPDEQVWLVYGDGSAGYSVAEYDTFVRHNVPVIAVVGNDASWQQIARDQIKIFHDSTATELAYTHYEHVAEGFGGKGILVESKNELDKALKEAVKLEKQGHPVLVNIKIGKSDFRDGSISI